MNYTISIANDVLSGEVTLDGSKSISNRVLVIQALTEGDFEIKGLSTSDDTNALLAALKSKEPLKDVGAAGTTMRFLTAYYALQKGEWILTGSERMKQRPIGILVDALGHLGADIQYLEGEGCPPLKIQGGTLKGGKVRMSAGVSSQYLSALLMIAPVLKEGLVLELEGQLVSRPYLMMTLNVMHYFGIEYSFEGNIITIAPQAYIARNFVVEADWSAASYYYGMAVLSSTANIYLKGLHKESLQGDRVLVEMMETLGIKSEFTEEGVRLSKAGELPQTFQYNFMECPDLAQTLAVACAGARIPAIFDGLITLSIKETDRTAALRDELAKFGVVFQGEGDHWEMTVEQANFEAKKRITIATYHDHRMAMAFAALALKYKGGLIIENAMVVTKSYGNFWEDLKQVGEWEIHD